jgi:glutamyl-tRNA synthetase
MSIPPSRVRFAPSPTGFMHLGNVRAALINYLFARQYGGTFILRIEDTDQQRNISPQSIFDDLAWLSLTYDEGPGIGGPYEPYFQSQRTSLYQDFLSTLESSKKIYRCFCTLEDLENKRLRQMTLRQPPRYDRTCLQLSSADIEQRLASSLPFIWRFKLDGSSVTMHDFARGDVTYDLNHFSDFAITRPDGSFTFIFANFVDDCTMHISMVIRGEDHLSNTANQVALYKAFDTPLPTFWHLPIICNVEGKKLSKRDFGFSLTDLRTAGFLPQAICNYLVTIGGSFDEIASLSELAQRIDLKQIASTSHIRYDVEKLRWINHQWIMRLELDDLARRCLPFIVTHYPQAQTLSNDKLKQLLTTIRSTLTTLADSTAALSFYFARPQPSTELLEQHEYLSYKSVIQQLLSQEDLLDNPALFNKQISALCKEHNLPAKNLFALIRIAITGSPQGYAIVDLLTMLDKQEVKLRLQVLS